MVDAGQGGLECRVNTAAVGRVICDQFGQRVQCRSVGVGQQTCDLLLEVIFDLLRAGGFVGDRVSEIRNLLGADVSDLLVSTRDLRVCITFEPCKSAQVVDVHGAESCIGAVGPRGQICVDLVESDKLAVEPSCEISVRGFALGAFDA